MHAFKPVLSGKGLLAASIALLSGQALAEAAGRVSFVSGDVSVSVPGGASRALQKGDVINGGDKISTRAGRIQIRFSDGGFVSLQPNTVFGVDEYLYSNRKPEETSLFFSLIEGGMRTITGAIGKVNKQSYKVRTPVATIGIRGTEYLASLTDRGLIVSVGAGFVHVANGQGETTGGAGQNIFVPDASSGPQLSSEAADVQASGVEGDQEQELAEESSEDTGADETVAVGDVQNANGDYIFLFTTEPVLQSSDLVTGTPRYYISSASFGNTTNGGLGLLATFDQNGAISGSKGALLKAYTASKNADPTAPDFDSGTLHFANVQTIGGLSWGEFTNGSSATNQIFSTNPIVLTATEFMPYIIGLAPVSNLGKGSATYTLQGGTTPRDNNGQIGSLDSFKITVNLDFATLDLAMKVTMPAAGGTQALAVATTTTGNTYDVHTLNSQPVGVFNLGTAGEFFLDYRSLAVTDSSGSCGTSGSGSCSAKIDGFFVGDGAAQIGAAYQIDNFSNNQSISGVAALGLSSYSGTAATAPDGPGYSLAFAKTTSAGSSSGFFGGYDDGGNQNSLTNTFDTQGLLSARQYGSDTLVLETALVTNIGRHGNLNWGRWYGGNITINSNLVTLGTNQSLHYITGPMTQPNFFDGVASSPQFGAGSTATYTYQGGTTATGTDGSSGSIASGSTLTVTFGFNPTLAVDVGINMSGGTGNTGLYQLNGSGINVGISGNSGTATFNAASGSGISLSGSACASGPSCLGASATIDGFFAGQQAQQIGMSYQVNDSGRTVNGAAGFDRGTITPSASTSPL